MKQKLENASMSEVKTKPTSNPFTRKDRDINGAKPKKEDDKTPKRMFEKRDPLEARMELKHGWNQIKLRTIPFLKSLLCFDFFARVVIFFGLTYFVSVQVRGMSDEKKTLQQGALGSPNRYSKTFGRETALDKLLSSTDDKELPQNGVIDGKSQ